MFHYDPVIGKNTLKFHLKPWTTNAIEETWNSDMTADRTEIKTHDDMHFNRSRFTTHQTRPFRVAAGGFSVPLLSETMFNKPCTLPTLNLKISIKCLSLTYSESD